LKRNLGETVQQFSTRFNKVYHSIPVDVRPPPGLAQLHYLDAFDTKMPFQLRERDTTTLEEMKNVAIDVESNLLYKRSKLRVEEKARTEKKQMTPSDVKLDVLANTIKEMMQEISSREEIVVQGPYVPLMPEKERINVPKHLAAQPQHFDSPNDYFMHSIHDTVEDVVQNQKMEEDSPDMICMFNGISSMDDSPKLDWYDDIYDHKEQSLGVS
jgi:hypothetical protein